MALVSGLQREMCILGLLLIVYFTSLTVVSDAASEATKPLATKHSSTITAAKTSSLSTISPHNTVPAPVMSTAAPKPTSTPTGSKAPAGQPTTPPEESGRKFDGASFVGGIVLGVVIAVIIILAFKWWQSRKKSYHSL